MANDRDNARAGGLTRRGVNEPQPEAELPRHSGGGNGLLIGLAAFSVMLLVGVAALAPLQGAADAEPRANDEPRSGLAEFLTAADIDPSEALVNFSISIPGFDEAVPGDDGTGPLPLGEVNELPGADYLNFLFEFCQPECYRDAHFMNQPDARIGSGPWTAGRPFHVRHGFINNDVEPLGEGFDVVMYITLEGEGELRDAQDGARPADNPLAPGQTYRLTSDYVLRGTTERCGPTYKTQTEPQTCEWFVHEFPRGLPAGRYDLWAVWVAPCGAWTGLGYDIECDDPAEPISLFSSGVNSPFDSEYPSFTEADES